MSASIFIIDDEEDIRDIIRYNLMKEGYQVTTAENGEQGLALMKEVKPHLVLLDVMMPGLDGIEVCDQIRNSPGFEKTLICFLTARSEDYSQIAGLDAGADDYVTKPVKPKVLISRVNALLRRNNLISLNKDKQQELLINRDKYVIIKNFGYKFFF